MWAYQCSRQKLCYTNDYFHTFQCGKKNALFSSFFPLERLLSGATCDWYKRLALCFDVLGWLLLSLFFTWITLSQSIILMAQKTLGISKPMTTHYAFQEELKGTRVGLENVFRYKMSSMQGLFIYPRQGEWSMCFFVFFSCVLQVFFPEYTLFL